MNNICWGRNVWGIDPANYASFFTELKSKGYGQIEVGTPQTSKEANHLKTLAVNNYLTHWNNIRLSHLSLT